MKKESLKAMGEAIRHRGPDDNGLYVGDGVALGNQRLSIIDVKGGHQPFVSDDGKIIVVQNGEIFNHIEIAEHLSREGIKCKTRSDTEVLLRLYERYGIDFLYRLNGMFSFIVFDGNEKAIYLVRDRIGVKPLFIHDDGTRLLFASEIKSLLAAGVPAEMDVEALNLFLAYNYVPPPKTMFKNVRHLMPGHFMRIDTQSTTTHCWWDLASLSSEEDRSDSYWVDEFNTTLDDSVSLRMRSDVPYGAFLSGGVDSSTIVGLMCKHSSKQIKTFSIGFDDPRYDESKYAKQAADRFGAEHINQKVSSDMFDLWSTATYYCDQPHGDVSFLPMYRLSQLASQHVKMVLTGDGGDELFAGYDKYKEFFSDQSSYDCSDDEFRYKYYNNICLFDDEQRARLFNENIRTEIQDIEPWKQVADIFDRTSHLDRINQALLVDMLLLLPGNNLVKPDRMGMASSIEARTPLLDYRMMELAFRMPGTVKLKDGVTKYIFKKAVVGLIGEELAYRKKQMFTVPIGEWFKTSLSETVYEYLLSSTSMCHAYFDSAYIRELIESHMKNIENNTRQIRALLAVEIWCRTFLNAGNTYHGIIS
jgi:asparagine synthase (glutamine-hydrolysing)